MTIGMLSSHMLMTKQADKFSKPKGTFSSNLKRQNNCQHMEFTSKMKQLAREMTVTAPKSISIRLPEGMLAVLKTLANKKDVPYQSMAKIYLARQIS
jgi:predicted DNA binding CopG/RHH family protein